MSKNIFEVLIDDLPEMLFSAAKDLKILAISSVVPVILELFAEYVFDDWQIVGYLVPLVFFDTLTKLSSLKRSKQRFSLKLLANSLFNKLIKYSALLAISHILDNVKSSDGEVMDLLTGWASSGIYILLIVIEVESIFTNIGFAVGGKLKKVIDTVKEFGNFNKEENDGKENQNQ